jgi:hypothetical protein
MTAEDRAAALDRAVLHSRTWLASLDQRSVPPSIDADEMVRRLGDLPDEPTPAADVVDLLAEACEPGLVAIPPWAPTGSRRRGTRTPACGR